MFIYIDENENIIAIRNDGKDLKIPIKYKKIEVEDTEENKNINTCTKRVVRGKIKYNFSYVEPVEEVIEDVEKEVE